MAELTATYRTRRVLPPSRVESAAFILFVLGALSALGFAQAGASSNAHSVGDREPPLSKGSNQFGFWGGYSPKSFVFEGQTQDRKLFLLTLQYARVLLATHPVTLKYTVELVPAALENQPRDLFVSKSKLKVDSPGVAYGAGFTPVGFQFNFGRRRVQPFLNGSGGLLYFSRQLPVPQSSQLNFTYSAGIGAEIFVRPGRSVTVGWKYHHLSNANTGTFNPGIDSGLFYAGFSWVRRK